MSSLAETYHQRAGELLARAWETNAPAIARLAPLVGASIADGGVVHTFGSGHSELISREIIGRAGGLVCVTGIIDPTGGFIENLPGYGEKLAARSSPLRTRASIFGPPSMANVRAAARALGSSGLTRMASRSGRATLR